MARTKSSGKSARGKNIRSRTEIRFANPEHHELVAKAAALDGGSINSWLVRVTLKAAREELKNNAD